jgi:SAM-dependent methyltransferase
MTLRPPDFDFIAQPYRALEYITLGRTVERTRLHFLPSLMPARRALVIGDGDGRFLAKLLAENTALHATVVDTSAAMLELLSRRCAPFADRLETHQTDALSFVPTDSEPYDLAVTHFFVDCLTQEELRLLAERIAPLLAPGALWVVSDFRIAEGALRWPSRLFIRTLYFGFRILTGLRTTHLPDHVSALTAAGLIRIDAQLLLAGILTAELWQKSPAALHEEC